LVKHLVYLIERKISPFRRCLTFLVIFFLFIHFSESYIFNRLSAALYESIFSDLFHNEISLAQKDGVFPTAPKAYPKIHHLVSSARLRKSHKGEALAKRPGGSEKLERAAQLVVVFASIG